MSRVRRLPVALPPADEQAALIQFLDERFTQTTRLDVTLKETIEQVAALDRSTLAKAFRGELVAQDPNDEPAEVMLARVQGANRAANGPAAKHQTRGERPEGGARGARADRA
jgi:type I restriction enzyme S subunit